MSNLRSDLQRFPARIDNRASSRVYHVEETTSTVQRPRAPRRGYTYSFANSGGYSRMNTCALDDDYNHTPPRQSHSASLQPLARKRSATYAPGDNVNLLVEYTDAGQTTGDNAVVMTGWLYKMSRLKTSKARGHRQHRRFRLTAHSLEYDQLFQKVKQFPLTSIIDIIYNEYNNPLEFKLVFQNSELILEAPNQQNCIQWVEHIKEEWERWNIACKQFNLLLRTDENAISPKAEAYLKKNQGYFEAAKQTLELTIPGLVTCLNVAEEYFGNVSKTSEKSSHGLSNSVLQKFQARVGLAPRVRRSVKEWKSFSHEVGDKKDFTLLSKCNFVMIKYPRKGRSMPHERVFKMDFENLLIMWHQTEDSKFSYLRTLMTEHIVDVRKGQNSDGFDRYPYDEMKKQSLSVLFEGEKRTVPGGKKYAILESLDLICDTPEEQKLWHHTLRQFVSPKFHLYSSHHKSADPMILPGHILYVMSLTFVGWLVTHWSTLTNDAEVREDTVVSFGYSLVPTITYSRIQELLTRAHQCQLKESEHHGHSLHWDGFIFFFNLLCEIDESNCLLLGIFQDYAKTYPLMGMTVEEFQKFLIEYQQWPPEDATNEKCIQLMINYDFHYRAYKMHKANSTPVEFYISLCLLSFGGFLSFLRSPDNSVVDRNHERVYQDMKQPLSHYFINSSHNTYLEGHQLTGRSTTDAYVRALLQGCRCLELDCWDGPNGEPRITHGNTFVSDLSLEEVTETIDKYGFVVSTYPIILSLENHCSPEQQVRMAEIFVNIFGDKLAKENLVELNNLDRLPSPHQLQRKIILKGTEPSAVVKSTRTLPLAQLKVSLPSTKQRTKRKAIISKSTWEKSSEVGTAAETEDIFQYQATDQRRVNEQNDIAKLPKDNKGPQDDDDGDSSDDDDDENDIENSEKDLSENLSDLIVYCRTKRIRPWSWDAQKTTSVCNMFSFNESTALTRCRDTSEMLACTERQFVRTYPAGTRIDSSNYDPIPLWNHGVQMVALNVQTPENFMFLNQGKFRQNGGCGYVLKPKVMRNTTGTEYTPSMDEPLKEITPVNLEITPISGQHFIVLSKKTVSMEILYETYGIPHDCEKQKFSVNSRETNPLWPQFQNVSPLEKTIYMPELCLVLFAVYIRINRKLKAGTKQILLGQNVFSLESLKPGLHFIPLRTAGGESASHIGIFVKIKMNNLSHRQASSSGICSQQNNSMRWPSSKVLKTHGLQSCSLDRRAEDTPTIKEKHECKDTSTRSFSHSAAVENSTDLHKQSRIVHQEAALQCTAEIHANPFTDGTIV